MSSDELVADLKLAAVAQEGTLPAKAERPFAPVAPDATRATQATQPARAQAIFFMLSPFSSGRLGLAAPPFPHLEASGAVRSSVAGRTVVAWSGCAEVAADGVRGEVRSLGDVEEAAAVAV